MAEGGAGKKYDKNILWEEEGGKNRREEDDHVEERIREKKIGFIRKSERRREAYKEKGKGGWLENGQEKTCTKVKSKFWISFLQLRKTYGRLFIASQQREEGEREARRRITAAEKAGAERLESACRAAEIKVKKMMTEEEEKNAKETAERQEEAARLYEEIKAEGERHLDQAAEWIVRRVVEF